MESKPEIKLGLEGVYFTESGICKVDGINGKLYYYGYSIETLAENSNFEETCFLLLNGRLPDESELSAFRKTLASERELPAEIVSVIRASAKTANAMDLLRSTFSMLSLYDKDANDNSEEANMRKSIRFISKIASITAAIGSFRQGREYVKPDSSMGHVENFLYMLNGKKPKAEEVKILDLMFLLHAEHSSNASTFSGIVTASTLSDLHSSITSAIGTLKGPLHGGADEAALHMMHAIGSPENTEAYINDALAGKKKIMGFGHRVYKTYDPRARIIKRRLEELRGSADEEVKNLTNIALAAEKLMIDKLGASHGIWPNVDFFSGPVYTDLGIPDYLFTPLFAASRVPGWCAHIMQYWKSNRLVRPLEYYNGEIDRKYVPIEGR
jgi:citrate synthase